MTTATPAGSIDEMVAKIRDEIEAEEAAVRDAIAPYQKAARDGPAYDAPAQFEAYNLTDDGALFKYETIRGFVSRETGRPYVRIYSNAPLGRWRRRQLAVMGFVRITSERANGGAIITAHMGKAWQGAAA